MLIFLGHFWWPFCGLGKVVWICSVINFVRLIVHFICFGISRVFIVLWVFWSLLRDFSLRGFSHVNYRCWFIILFSTAYWFCLDWLVAFRMFSYCSDKSEFYCFRCLTPINCYQSLMVLGLWFGEQWKLTLVIWLLWMAPIIILLLWMTSIIIFGRRKWKIGFMWKFFE